MQSGGVNAGPARRYRVSDASRHHVFWDSLLGGQTPHTGIRAAQEYAAENAFATAVKRIPEAGGAHDVEASGPGAAGASTAGRGAEQPALEAAAHERTAASRRPRRVPA